MSAVDDSASTAELTKEHRPERIRERINQDRSGYVGDGILGGVDGIHPGVEGEGTVELKTDGVPVHPGRAGGPLQHPLGDSFREPRWGIRFPYEIGVAHKWK